VTPPVQALGRPAFAQTPSDSTGAVTTLVARLMQGTTEIASWTHEQVAVEFTTIEQLLSDVQADLIADYGDLRLIFEATATAPPEDDGGGEPVEAGPVTAGTCWPEAPRPTRRRSPPARRLREATRRCC
jgi:hypothetical protein